MVLTLQIRIGFAASSSVVRMGNLNRLMTPFRNLQVHITSSVPSIGMTLLLSSIMSAYFLTSMAWIGQSFYAKMVSFAAFFMPPYAFLVGPICHIPFSVSQRAGCAMKIDLILIPAG